MSPQFIVSRSTFSDATDCLHQLFPFEENIGYFASTEVKTPYFDKTFDFEHLQSFSSDFVYDVEHIEGSTDLLDVSSGLINYGNYL